MMPATVRSSTQSSSTSAWFWFRTGPDAFAGAGGGRDVQADRGRTDEGDALTAGW